MPTNEQSARIEDLLGAPYTTETIALPDDDEGEVFATLIHRPADGGPGRGAVLQVHGFCDYFFHTEYAEWWAARGYDFYALDLRKYGRSLRPHHTPNYVTDLADYWPELDAAWEHITERDGHTSVIATAHSTGGLTLPLWADARRPAQLTGMVLNSPWFDLQGHALMRSVGTLAIRQIGAALPHAALPRSVSGYYTQSLHTAHGGEWDFDLAWKPVTSFPVRLGWIRAVREGHDRLHRGLDVRCPVLVLSSDDSFVPTRMSERVHRADVVLDVRQIRRWATAVGGHVTYVAVPEAKHDIWLSRAEPRARAYAELDTWLDAYLPGPAAPGGPSADRASDQSVSGAPS
ncbi:alpha/beta hydrolase [Nocardioides insulae]|uniref:alpha/beta hydrolase n=1 Tax=Nocardioides insulae TaxID=394734 RepID=UPI0006861D63|nr:alpha/beta hydrolase [Nocardioides insulae]